MDVAGWLRDLGLERYEQAFRDNDVDAEVLPRLTADDLIAIGVTSVGHRRKLLNAIASLSTSTERAEDMVPLAAAPERQIARVVEAERRQLTVMFVDLVGSTGLASKLDPEDLREMIGSYHRWVADTISRFEGFVAKYMGDGVLIYFGYPQAHEDDAERAVRAGLALIQAVGSLGNATVERLQIRIGIGTGPVIVGDLIGRGEAQERGVVGETPNLAARLQAIAEPNTVVIALSTRRLIGNLFEYHDLGAIAAKGFNEPVPAFKVLRDSGVQSRFEAFHSSALTPLVGRKEEIELLLRRWAQQRMAKVKWCCFRESPASANRASPLPCWNGCKTSHTRACATSARLITR
jgi:class 3 adenylate cyclase